jgi:hypothetical protein
MRLSASPLSSLLTLVCAPALFTASVSAGTVWIDVTAGATITGLPNNGPIGNVPPLGWPAAEGPSNIADDNFRTKFLHFAELNTGYIAAGGNSTVPVTGMVLITANDAAERDPASYTLEGSNDGSNWSPISSGALALPTTRTGNTAAAMGGGLGSQRLTFANAIAYQQYRVIFPTVRNSATATSMQIAEVSLLGSFDPGADVLDLQSYSATNVGGTFPPAESPAQAIDNNVDSKYLNFNGEGTGIRLTTAGLPTILTAITLSHANDAPARDPFAFTLRGSNDGTNFTDIVVNQSLASGMVLWEGTTASFANGTAYRDYEFIVTALRDTTVTDLFQFSELQLHGTLIPEPGTALLGLVKLSGLMLRRRR